MFRFTALITQSTINNTTFSHQYQILFFYSIIAKQINHTIIEKFIKLYFHMYHFVV